MRTPQHPHEPDSSEPSAMDAVRLRRLDRRQAEGRRLPGFDMPVAEAEALTVVHPHEHARGLAHNARNQRPE
ncbi:hypothetical protein ABT039_40715 [Streptomyces lasiicapitis]|uniref:hypothetical protein n=1 Tax=Streptomyces lasiicapitis TaxID=1923961 RepID=UPI00331B4AD1